MATVNISAWAKKTNKTLDQMTRGIQIKLFNSVIMDTRVDLGRMRGNWQTNIGASTDSQIERLDISGAKAMAEVTATVKSGDVTYFTNNVPYVEVYEQKDGMVAKNMARIESILRGPLK